MRGFLPAPVVAALRMRLRTVAALALLVVTVAVAILGNSHHDSRWLQEGETASITQVATSDSAEVGGTAAVVMIDTVAVAATAVQSAISQTVDAAITICDEDCAALVASLCGAGLLCAAFLLTRERRGPQRPAASRTRSLRRIIEAVVPGKSIAPSPPSPALLSISRT